MKSKLLLFTAFLVAFSCAKKKEDESSDSYDSSVAVVESGMTAIAGVADDVAGNAFTVNTPEKPSHKFFDLLVARAYAASCARPLSATCSSGVRSMSYSSCTLPSGLRSLSGSASLTYSNSSCAISNVNDYVTRAYQIDITGPAGGVVTTSSAVATDYNGLSYGGGGRLTVRAGYYDLDILGKHKTFTRRGRTLFNISMRTTTPIQLSTLSRAGRQISAGVLEVNHNSAKFSTVMTFSGVQWSNSCCYPTAGTIAMNRTGTKQGSATVTFTGCGTAQLTEDGQTQNFELSYCE